MAHKIRRRAAQGAMCMVGFGVSYAGILVENWICRGGGSDPLTTIVVCCLGLLAMVGGMVIMGNAFAGVKGGK